VIGAILSYINGLSLGGGSVLHTIVQGRFRLSADVSPNPI
jgi:hypothetical protein